MIETDLKALSNLVKSSIYSTQNKESLVKPVVKLISQELHNKLFHKDFEDTPLIEIEKIRDKLALFNLQDIEDETVGVNLPVPSLDCPLPAWLERETFKEYGWYKELAENFSGVSLPLSRDVTNFFNENKSYFIPPASTIKGWSKFDRKKDKWIACKTPGRDCLYLDFETIKVGTKWLPFMCAALDTDGNIYSWLPPSFEIESLPTVVSFGEDFKLGIGHNVVGYDRRYIKEAYTLHHDLRFLDTLSFYYLVQGMPSSMMTLHKKLSKEKEIKPKWWYETCGGSLKALSNYYLNVDIDKSVRDEIIELENLNPLNNTQELNKFWNYCLTDVYYGAEIYKILWDKFKQTSPHIVGFAGQIERSNLIIGVSPDYEKELNNIDREIFKVRETRNDLLNDALEICISQGNALFMKTFEEWREKEFYLRVLKTKACEEVCKSQLRWELKKSGVKWLSSIEERVAVVEEYLETNKTKCKEKTILDFCKSLWKKRDDKKRGNKQSVCPESYISIMGKVTPYILQMHWNNKPLQFNGDTWGVYSNDEFIELPHPGGSGNVGTPLSKDFRSKVKTKEFTSPIADLSEIYENINIVSTWESFRDRFYGVYIYEDKWLPDIIPSGTVTERATGLAVVMPNTNPKRAGSECKHLFNAVPGYSLISADYDAMESYIGATIGDSTSGYVGSCVSSVTTLLGDKTKGTDDHTVTAKLVGITRPLAKNFNFANIFMCGVNKLATMAFIGLAGEKDIHACKHLAESFIKTSRGEKEYGKYKYGMASDMFNKLTMYPKADIQKTIVFDRHISRPLQQRFIDGDYMTTRVNFCIQPTGQEMLNTALVTMRILAKRFKIPHQLSFLIHDDIKLLQTPGHIKNSAWLLQMGHLFSKGMLTHALNLNTLPLNQCWFSGVEVDNTLRKSYDDPGVTPSKLKPTAPGINLTPADCFPTIVVN